MINKNCDCGEVTMSEWALEGCPDTTLTGHSIQ